MIACIIQHSHSPEYVKKSFTSQLQREEKLYKVVILVDILSQIERLRPASGDRVFVSRRIPCLSTGHRGAPETADKHFIRGKLPLITLCCFKTVTNNYKSTEPIIIATRIVLLIVSERMRQPLKYVACAINIVWAGLVVVQASGRRAKGHMKKSATTRTFIIFCFAKSHTKH